MATTHEFSVKLSNGKRVELTTSRPSTVSDKAWEEKLSGDVEDRINDLAFQNWVIKAQAAIRKAETREEAEAILARYQYGAGGSRAATLSAEDAQQFSEEQLAILKAQGVKIEK